MRPFLKATPLLVAAFALLLSGCFEHGGRLLGAVIATAVVTAAIVSSQPPPPPRHAHPPPPRAGYTWEPGYWTLEGDQWVWVDGSWIPNYPGYAWQPTHWEQDPSGYWRLVPGRWIRYGPPPPPLPPPPPSGPPPPYGP